MASYTLSILISLKETLGKLMTKLRSLLKRIMKFCSKKKAVEPKQNKSLHSNATEFTNISQMQMKKK